MRMTWVVIKITAEEMKVKPGTEEPQPQIVFEHGQLTLCHAKIT